jgi:hypothetical protein
MAATGQLYFRSGSEVAGLQALAFPFESALTTRPFRQALAASMTPAALASSTAIVRFVPARAQVNHAAT